jgi:hypothetical protein
MQFGCSLGDGGGAKSLLLKRKQHTKWTNKRMQWLKTHSCAGWQTVKCGVKEKEKKELMTCGCILFKEHFVEVTDLC